MLFDIVNQYDSKKISLLTDLRKACVLHLQTNEDPRKILSFLGNAGIVSIDEDKKIVYIGTPNEFMMLQIKKFFGKLLKKTIHQCYNEQFGIEIIAFPLFQSGNHPLQHNLKKILTLTSTSSSIPATPPAPAGSATQCVAAATTNSTLNSRYQFSNFVVGSHNQLAYSAAQCVAEAPGKAYNPYFVYGPVGLGKTHLLQAIGNDIRKKHNDKNVVYMPASSLIDMIIGAMRNKKMSTLMQKMRKIDVLIIDDIQFLADKEKTQEIFHTIFNQFVHDRRQIILSSDRAPRELHLLEARLRSRFSTGLVVDIKKVEYETKLAILQTKLAEKDIQMDDTILHLLAKHIVDNIRELEGALNILITKQTMLHKELDEGDAIDALSTLGYDATRAADSTRSAATQKNNRSTNTYDTMVAFVANYYDLAVHDITGRSRKRAVSLARQMLMYIAKEQYNWTLEKIGDYFGGKNHSSVIYAINTFSKHLKRDATIHNDYSIVTNEC